MKGLLKSASDWMTPVARRRERWGARMMPFLMVSLTAIVGYSWFWGGNCSRFGGRRYLIDPGGLPRVYLRSLGPSSARGGAIGSGIAVETLRRFPRPSPTHAM